MLDINVRAAHMLTRLFLPEMIKRNSGRILNISSLSAWVPVASLSAYSAGKAYLLSFSDGIQSELKALKITGVQVSVATPAFYHTNIGGSKLQVQGSAAAVDTFIGNLVIKFLAGKTLIVDKTYGLVPIMCGLWVRNLLRIILWRYVKKTVVRK